MTTDDGPDFEAALAEVQQIVEHLESGELGLGESLQQYEIGVKRLKRCHAMLDAAEQQVSLLSGFDADGNPVTEPLEPSATRTGAGRVGKRKKKTTERGDSSNHGGTAAGRDRNMDDPDGLF